MAARDLKPARDLYRTSATLGVLFVAAVALMVSYLHISHLALVYGQPRISAYLMPLSVDGLVTVSSMAMLRSARAGAASTPGLARSGLALGVMATIAANVTSGLSHGVIGAVIAGWPAVAFVISAEIAITMVRRKTARTPAQRGSGPVTSDVTFNSDGPAVTSPVSDRPGDRTARHRGRAARQSDQEQRALTALTADPDMSYPELAEELGVSESTARRVKARLNGQAPKVAA